MPTGGARNRSGPQADPRSGRSDARGLSFSTLPSEGHQGPAPAFPLLGVTGREETRWAELWRTPQAVAWAREPWRTHTVAMYVRLSVRLEDPEAPASLIAGVIRYADQLGLTPAGLRENGWTIAADEVAAVRDERTPLAVVPDAPADWVLETAQ